MTELSLGKRVVRGAAWSGAGTIVLRLGGLVVGIILARILTPEQFGVYAIALTVQGILLTVADLGLSADIIRNDDPKRIAPTVATVGLLSGGLLTAGAIAGSGMLAQAMGSAEAGPAIAVLSATLLLGGVGVVPYGMLVREFRQKELFLIGVVDFVVSTVVTLVLVALGFGVMGLAIGRVVAQTCATTLQFVATRSLPRFGLDRGVIGPVLAFGVPIGAANLLSWTLLNADNVVLARIAGATALGFYVLAFNISSWPMTALAQVIRSISLPYFSRTRSESGGLAVLSSIAWAGALPAGTLLAVLSVSVIDVVYGGKWLPAAPVLAALGVYGGLRVMFDVFAGFLYAHGRSTPVLWIQAIWLVTLIGAMIPATMMFGIVGAGWAHVLVAVVIVLPCYLIALRSAGVDVWGLLKSLLRPTAATLPALAAAYVIASVIPNHLVSLLVGGSAAVLVYGAIMFRWILGRVRDVRAIAPEGNEVST